VRRKRSGPNRIVDDAASARRNCGGREIAPIVLVVAGVERVVGLGPIIGAQ
jgi:hypothetical protein